MRFVSPKSTETSHFVSEFTYSPVNSLVLSLIDFQITLNFVYILSHNDTDSEKP
jgi:hypothetical protein